MRFGGMMPSLRLYLPRGFVDRRVVYDASGGSIIEMMW